MELKYNVGDRIVISLNTGDTFEGDFTLKYNGGFQIENMHHYESGSKIRARYWFSRNEIKTIHRLNIIKKGDVGNSTSREKKHPSSNSNCILLDKEEYYRLKELTGNYIYLKTADENYFDAVNVINNFESIGVFAIGAEKGRCGKITVIALSTWKQVYIFDIKSFKSKKIPNEIADILKSYYIKKVIHNGGTLKDCLQHSHNIIMNNIFDTQISHMMLKKNATGESPKTMSSIGECLTEYFNFSPTFLTMSLEVLNESWDDRPLEDDKLNKMSRLVTYLITIKDYQMSLMMKDYEKAVTDFHDLFTKREEYEMRKLSAAQECSKDIDDIIPKELLKFKSIETVKALNY